MTVQITQSVWLDASETCTFTRLVEISGLSAPELHDLVETGVIEPCGRASGEYQFSTQCMSLALRARRLRDDFELNPHGVALALSLLRRIDTLEAALARHRDQD